MSNSKLAIGRMKTVLVSGHDGAATGVVATLSARVRRATRGRRLTFSGPAAFAPAAVEHLSGTVLAVVDRIVHGLGRKRAYFVLSLVNLGAASATGLGLDISGFSADAAACLALLSAAIKMPVPQDVAVTGHIASTDGDIRAVRNLRAKLAAAVRDEAIQAFVHPRLDADTSLGSLSPGERDGSAGAIADARRRLRVVAVADVCGLVEAVASDESVIRSALRSGFFDMGDMGEKSGGPVDQAVQFLVGDHSERFWRVLEGRLRRGAGEEAGDLLLARCRYEVRRKRYPAGFGRRLERLVLSLPPATRRFKIPFPLVPLDHCLRLCRFAASGDEPDVQSFLDATRGKPAGRDRAVPAGAGPEGRTTRDATAAVDAVLGEISAQALAEEIGLPIDQARATFVMDEVTLDSHEAFLDTVTAFYLALIGHAEVTPSSADVRTVGLDAFAVLERAFRDRGGADAAWAEARYGTHGGMRLVLDTMADQYRSEQQAKRVDQVLKTALDPLDWDARVAFMRAFLQRIGPQLPPEIREQPPEHFARHYQPILETYVRSLDRVTEVLRRL